MQVASEKGTWVQVPIGVATQLWMPEKFRKEKEKIARPAGIHQVFWNRIPTSSNHGIGEGRVIPGIPFPVPFSFVRRRVDKSLPPALVGRGSIRPNSTDLRRNLDRCQAGPKPVLPLRRKMARGQNPVVLVNIPIPTKIRSQIGGEFTYPKMGSQWF